jgi:hypothetical protein
LEPSRLEYLPPLEFHNDRIAGAEGVESRFALVG